jgi:hypothetical protein
MPLADSASRTVAMPEASRDRASGTATSGNKMIYARLSVFSMYAAFVTAENEKNFLDEFRNVVLDALGQYEAYYGAIGQERTDCIKKELAALVPVPLSELCSLSFDLKTDGGGCRVVIAVEEVFTNKEEVQSRFKPWVDEVNEDCAEDEKWAVFDGGFFPSTQGFEIDELFK